MKRSGSEDREGPGRTETVSGGGGSRKVRGTGSGTGPKT